MNRYRHAKEGLKGQFPRLVGLKRSIENRMPSPSFPLRSFVSAGNSVRKQIRMGSFPILLDYPVTSEPRYGWGKPPHELLNATLDAGRTRYLEHIEQFEKFAEQFRSIPADAAPDSTSPYWSNSWTQGMDAVALYSFPAIFGSKRYIEIGSGNSTKFVKRSIMDNGLDTEIISIDPVPRAEVDSLCDVSLREPLEATNIDVVDSLGDGDVLMFDGSHRCFQNSDVTVMFLEILPRLKAGVLVFIHDMFLPYDYRPEWSMRWYSEQYLLAVLLLNDAQRRYEILYPALFVDMDPELRARAERFWDTVGHSAPLPNGATGFWLRVKDTANASNG